MLAGNALTSLPSTMAQCRNLQLLRISVNQLGKIPSWLFSMPQLSWLAFASNIDRGVSQMDDDLTGVSWGDLTVMEQLGEGTSGIISKAHRQNTTQQEVAVKLFKGELTTDGLPTDEMYACMAAGVHPNLVQVLGRIDGHPEQKRGLMLELIPSTFKTLAGPPSLDTCTRDIYQPGTSFSRSKLAQIASGIAAAAAHLHSRGIMHGDLYAHNILVGPNKALLSDFGASTLYGKDYSDDAAAIERLEVRAFGYLLEELLEHIDPNDTHSESINAFTQLKEDCMQLEVLKRPNFAEICHRIADFRLLTETLSST
ncbi:unnamed protein product [Adineta steineri]|uniref:Protein kinase domain-containing protein n=1 Tax=Adineta steineri TaxID=433720 RepID=A0A814TU83_9BILA|nr:unnamed protein product [Adineta steineri]